MAHDFLQSCAPNILTGSAKPPNACNQPHQAHAWCVLQRSAWMLYISAQACTWTWAIPRVTLVTPPRSPAHLPAWGGRGEGGGGEVASSPPSTPSQLVFSRFMGHNTTWRGPTPYLVLSAKSKFWDRDYSSVIIRLAAATSQQQAPPAKWQSTQAVITAAGVVTAR